jgi:hypothetical protein
MMAAAPLVAYRDGSSSGSDSDEEYILPQKRVKADRTPSGMRILNNAHHLIPYSVV